MDLQINKKYNSQISLVLILYLHKPNLLKRYVNLLRKYVKYVIAFRTFVVFLTWRKYAKAATMFYQCSAKYSNARFKNRTLSYFVECLVRQHY